MGSRRLLGGQKVHQVIHLKKENERKEENLKRGQICGSDLH